MSAFYEHRLTPFDTFQSDNLTFFPHTHRHVELVTILMGQLTLSVGETSRTLGPGDMAIIFPNIIHSYRSEQDSSARLLIFNTELVREYAHPLNHCQPAQPFLSADEVHTDALYSLSALERDSAMSPEVQKGHLLVLLGRVLAPLTIERRPARADDNLLSKLLIYLDEHFTEELDLAIISEALSTSRFQISRCFSNRIGCRYNTYINALRAARAAELLRHTPMHILEAGYEAGFDSTSTYYRSFNLHYGMSPKAYQNQLGVSSPQRTES